MTLPSMRLILYIATGSILSRHVPSLIKPVVERYQTKVPLAVASFEEDLSEDSSRTAGVFGLEAASKSTLSRLGLQFSILPLQRLI